MAKFHSTNLGLWPEPARAPREVQGKGRNDVRLMTLDRKTGAIGHTVFDNLAEFFRPGDLLIVNNSRTIPAALLANINGHPQVLHLAAHQSSHQVIAELRTIDGGPDNRIIETDDVVTILNAEHQPMSPGRILQHFHPKSRFWTIATQDDWYDLARVIGRPIRYHYVDAPYDIHYYATHFGTVWGSSEMPSASRPFTDAMVHQLIRQGVEIMPLTLHTTVSSHEVIDGDPYPPLIPEWYTIPADTLARVQAASQNRRPIIAVGTTVVRALETWAYTQNPSGWTTHLITPETPPQRVTGLVTGLHDNFTSHLWLLYAFVGAEMVRTAYREASARGYHWHEFGDITLIR